MEVYALVMPHELALLIIPPRMSWDDDPRQAKRISEPFTAIELMPAARRAT
jgi:hypothetical protein